MEFLSIFFVKAKKTGLYSLKFIPYLDLKKFSNITIVESFWMDLCNYIGKQTCFQILHFPKLKNVRDPILQFVFTFL